MRNIAIIPARSGSKGLPDKNIKILNDKPLIAYSITSAIESNCFDVVMVSTDSKLYADVACTYGAEVPFLRSECQASDTASSWDVVEEVLNRYESLGESFDTFCLLQPTSPMRTADDIKNAYDLFVLKNGLAVISMTELEHPLEWCGKLDNTLSLADFHSGNIRRQDTNKYYRPNGAIYIASVSEFHKDHNLYREGSYGYIMSAEKSIDIDTELDFRFAEFLISKL